MKTGSGHHRRQRLGINEASAGLSLTLQNKKNGKSANFPLNYSILLIFTKKTSGEFVSTFH